ncbi:MAG: S4 domain-containing protein [Thermoanaerobaculia bacterium]|jgi:ribosome-associated heat shock protein Hsp15|nr:S4 domain-containing protein [Thermoanaerobaculia bacterium]
MDGVRLDKWLQVARVFKSRTQATHACDLGRVKVNGQAAKPHRSLALGDRVEVDKGDWERLLVVRELHDKPLPKAEAARLYDDLTPPRPVLSELEKLLRRPPEIRDRGTGRPTKRDRRLIEKLRSE